MEKKGFSRRSFVKSLGAAGALAYSGISSSSLAQQQAISETLQAQRASRERRMRWWHEAKFGMFIHWGLYSVIGQQEWVLESEGIPIPQYELLAKHFNPKPHAAREWARLARRAGQKYMVMTTKHHEGFCLWDSKLTNYCAARQAAGRDLVREFIDAAREEGLRVGLYYSLMDWHHPDGAVCANDETARKRFVEYTHGLLRELLTNYGKIDILWYDVDWPLNAQQWESERMNKMVFELQPDILVNNRNGLEGDFSTPEQHVEAAEKGRAWESCMTLNEGWGYQQNDNEWKTPKTILNHLARCAQGGGNYLLNIGPMPDGTVPPESVRILESVGRWMETNGKSIYGTERGDFPSFGNYDNFSKRGNLLYVHVYFWPAKSPAAQWLSFFQTETVVAIGGVKCKVKAARLLKTGAKVAFTQDDISLRLTGLPLTAPDDPITVIELECEGEPAVDHHSIRTHWQRYKTDISV